MIPIAMVTCREYPNLCRDDRLLLQPLRLKGFNPQPALWDDESVNWRKYRIIIIRSSWDFHKDIDQYYLWLTRMEKLGISVWNPVDIIRWNIDKTEYLKDLQNQGISTIPTLFIEKKSPAILSKIMDKHDWKTIIVKPRFGGSGIKIFKTGENIINDQKKLNLLLQDNDILVQPYIDEIQDGEYSFVFIGGKYSHCILKKPRPEEYRVNYKFGGIWTKIDASKDLILQAKKVYNLVKTKLLYARIDMIKVKGKLLLNELELSDPILFLEWYPEAANDFATSLDRFIKS